MFNQLLPQRFDNMYRGHKLAPWLFAVVVSVKIGQSLVVLFGGRSVVSFADGIPIDTYTTAGAQTVVSMFALLGLSRLLIGLLGILVLVRYRSMIPLMFVLLLLQDLGKSIILNFLPIARIGTPPGPAVNLVLLALIIAGLALSLRPRKSSAA